MKVYKFYMAIDQTKPATEEKMKVQCFASEHFEVFTIYNSVGYWDGKHERGLVLEVLIHESSYMKAYNFGQSLKQLLNQDKLILTVHDLTGDLI